MQEEIQRTVEQEEISKNNVNNKPAVINNILQFLYHIWWRVEITGIHLLPKSGPALVVGNTSGYIPWPALMLSHALIDNTKAHRAIYILINNNSIKDKRLDPYLSGLNFVPWSYDNAKQLLENGEIVVIFPEDSKVIDKALTLQHRVLRFDWTKFLPAVELHIPIYPLATLGVDEAKPFPFSLTTMPTPWNMKVIPHLHYNQPTDRPTDREYIQEKAKKAALRAEGDIQAEINRMLRARNKLF